MYMYYAHNLKQTVSLFYSRFSKGNKKESDMLPT